VLIVGFVVASLALSLYAVSLAHAGIGTMQTSETDRADPREALCLRAADLFTTLQEYKFKTTGIQLKLNGTL